MAKIYFPKEFFWGASTSAHQIEGGLKNDWTEWEKSKERLNKINLISKEEFISGQACDSFNKFNEDLQCIKELNLSAYRFSIDWSRVEPENEQWSDLGINYYCSIIQKLRKENIEPFITLWHWPIPLWIRDLGGWKSVKTLDYFQRFVNKIISILPKIKFWIILNEPEIYSVNSYLRGIWPPQEKCLRDTYKVFHNLIKAHNQCYSIIKKNNSNAQIGIAKNNVYFEAFKNNPINLLVKKIADWLWNFYFIDKIKNNLDFIGLNYYFHNRINYILNKNENKHVSDLGWELYPEGIYHCLIDLKKYQKPIYITENGLADEKDKYRSWFIKETLKYVHQAINDGVDVRGYFHWSLIDNFEWAYGFAPKFGLYEVNRKNNCQRLPRLSAKYYASICAYNNIEI